MVSKQNPIVIHDDDEDVIHSGFRRSRSMSAVSTASSHTMRAESSEAEVVPAMDRLSVQPSSDRQPSPKSSLETTRKRRRSELNDEDGSRQKQGLALDHRAERLIIDIDDEEDAGFRLQDADNHEEIDLEELEREMEHDLDEEEVIEDEERQTLSSRQSPRGLRNGPIGLPFVELDVYKWNGFFLKAGKTIELRNGTFLKIKNVIQNVETDQITMRGWQLLRTRDLGTRDLNGILPKKRNEVAFIFEVDHDDPRHYLEQSSVEVLLEDVLRIRRLVITNRCIPNEDPLSRFHMEYVQGDTKEERNVWIEVHEVLTARCKIVATFKTERQRLQYAKKPRPSYFHEYSVEWMVEEECTPGYSIPADVLRQEWCAGRSLGGSGRVKVGMKAELRAGYSRKSGNEKVVIDLLDDDDDRNVLNKENATAERLACSTSKWVQAYTYGDTFSGGGGSIRGAQMAGLEVIFGTDMDQICCETMRHNFGCEVYQMPVHEFATMQDPLRKLIVDILHTSFPCQPYSPLNTHRDGGKNFEKNIDAMLSAPELVKQTRPRIFTSENTFGILHSKSKKYFNKLVRMLIDLRFSVRWQIVLFQDFGLPQKRERLIIIAAGPGETLPKFPSATHNENGTNGMKKHTSVGSALNSIPRNATQHDITSTWGKQSKGSKPCDLGQIIRCLSTTGSDKYHHPHGRTFTHRELAVMQGFPHEHTFKGHCPSVITRQIGNAVPSSSAKILFGHIRAQMKRNDEAEQRQARAQMMD